MPTSNSAKKRLRQSIVRRDRNRSNRSQLKTLVRTVREAAAAGKADDAAKALQVATKKLDQAAAGRVIHANAAARLKSRLSKAIKAAKTAKAK